MKVAIIGASGQLGSDISKIFGDNAFPLSHNEIEVKDIDSCRRVLKSIDAGTVINCAAYVRVDDSEDNPEEAFMVNAIGARNVALICNENRMKNCYISTDFVFNGEKKKLYHEDDSPNPINIYGLSKYAGEILTRNYCMKFYIIRSASLYGEKGSSGKGGNFVDWIVEKSSNNEIIKVVDDIVMSPTYAKDAAEMIKNMIEKEIPYGVYHVTNQGYCSWFEFAEKIFEFAEINAKLSPIKSDEFNIKAKRPKFSALDSPKLNSFGLRMRNWEDALKDYLGEKGYLVR
ncbi:MAG: dTDP-4-dehydrorhamnose reductase [Methanocellales archaeon]|nr:dTDP-4-dehydrorhamnose reductase [Methanocellales archaeon]MDD4897792.1 dTDP-4-dehydrorhamnose reductase [Methanocellales archaeon]MDD5446572.1 dTDP-4-dehydrorhamnose reductase [Methanocellales archaeon]